MKKITKTLLLPALAVLLAGCLNRQAEVPLENKPIEMIPPAVMPATTSAKLMMQAETGIQEDGYGDTKVASAVAVIATDFKYDVKTINRKVGERIALTLTNNGKMPHDIKFDDLGVATKVLEPGKSETIYFNLDKAGTYEYYCSVGNHKAQGMVGKLIVK